MFLRHELVKREVGKNPTRSRRCERRILAIKPLGNREDSMDDEA